MEPCRPEATRRAAWHALDALPNLWEETRRVILEASRRYFGG
ncbi:MAG: hypothetical protein U1E87_11190 [Alphaproteobacteria bacterium]